MLRQTLAWRLTRWLLLCAIVVLGAIWAVAVYSVQEQMRIPIDSSAMAEVRNASSQIDRIFLTVQRSVENLAEVMTVRSVNNDEIRDFLQLVLTDLRQTNPAVCGGSAAPVPPNLQSPRSMSYFSLEKDKFVCKQLGTPDYRYWTMPWYTVPRDTWTVYWSEPYFDKGGGNVLMTTCSIPYFTKKNGKKNFAGVVTVDLDLRKLDRIMRNIQLHGIGYTVLLSKQGIYLSHPDPRMICRENVLAVARKLGATDLDYAGRRMIAGEEGMLANIPSSTTGRPTRFFYTPVRSTQWSIGIGFPIRELMRPLYIMELQLSLICIAGLLILVCGMLVLCKRITRPLLHLSDAAKAIGAGNLQAPLPDYPMEDEIGVLSRSFRQMQSELARFIRELKASTEARLHMEGELQAAGAIQRSLLPPTAGNQDPRFQLAATLHPAKGIGGDLYDFVFRNDRYAVLTIGDVSGKGVPAALFMAVMQTLQRSRMQDHPMPTEIADAVNAYLCKNNDALMFVTWFCAVVDLTNGDVHCVNAGHNAPRLMRKDGTMEILEQVDGAPFGIMEASYTESHLVMKPGDTLFCYTDGVTEAMDKDHQQYGEERMDTCLKKLSLQESPDNWIWNVKKDMEGFVNGAPQSDDITMLCFRYMGLQNAEPPEK